MKARWVAGLAVVGLALVACSASPNGSPASSTTPAPVTVTVPPTTVTAPPPPPPAQPTVTVTKAPPPPVTGTKTVEPEPYTKPPVEPDPLPSDEQIRTDAANAFDVVNTYWENLFATWVDPSGNPVSWYRPNLYHGDGFYDSTRGGGYDACGPLPPQNAEYCPRSGNVSWDIDMFREDEARHGNAPVYWTVAHEVGHAAQWRFRADNEEGAAPPLGDTRHAEQQADCLSGATLAKAEQDGYVTAEPGAVDEIVRYISEMEPGDHGTPAERRHAFQHGHDTGDVESCLYNQGVPPPGLFA